MGSVWSGVRGAPGCVVLTAGPAGMRFLPRAEVCTCPGRPACPRRRGPGSAGICVPEHKKREARRKNLYGKSDIPFVAVFEFIAKCVETLCILMIVAFHNEHLLAQTFSLECKLTLNRTRCLYDAILFTPRYTPLLIIVG